MVPLLAETAEVCEALALDPLGLLASGALTRGSCGGRRRSRPRRTRDEGIEAAAIGRLTEPAQGIRMLVDGDWHDVPSFPRDELARYFEEGLG